MHALTKNIQNFWETQAAGVQAPMFPTVDHAETPRSPNSTTSIGPIIPSGADLSTHTWDSCFRVGWAILQSRLTNSSDVVFGWAHVGQPPVFCRKTVHSGDCLAELLASDQKQIQGMNESSVTTLDQLRHLGGDVELCCNFQTLLQSFSSEAEFFNLRERENALSFACVRDSDQQIRLGICYDLNLMIDEDAQRLLHQFGKVMQQILEVAMSSTSTLRAGDIQSATPQDLDQIRQWNSNPLSRSDECIHEAIGKNVHRRPESNAIVAWDGTYTYKGMDVSSTRLAQFLIASGLRQQETVPICFDRSATVILCLLAVLKAGASFTLMDASYPDERLSTICQQVRARICITSGKHVHKFGQVQQIQPLIVDAEVLRQLRSAPDGEHQLPLAPVDANQLAYILFTSGSTGTPKGACVEHAAYMSCVRQFGPALNITSHSRTIQFASHAFGAALFEMIMPLVFGGCICVPSEADRLSGLPQFIRSTSANWAFFTPSYIRVLRPEQVPGLRTIVLGGEAIPPDVIASWTEHTCLLSAYGQSETSSICATGMLAQESDSRTIGQATGARMWLVEPGNPNTLAAIGSVGELVVESAGIARGYIGVPWSPESPFIHRPSWSQVSRNERECTRFYRTGDLFKYTNAGKLLFVGRSDSQVKIRGQRIELGEVESNLRKYLPRYARIVAEVVQGSTPRDQARLMVFLSENDNLEPMKSSTILPSLLCPETRLNIVATLTSKMPRHLIPSHYASIMDIPMTGTGKTDRARLRHIGRSLLDSGELGEEQPQSTRQEPTSEQQKLVARLWATVLGLDVARVAINHDFMALGGDSLAAIRLSSAATECGTLLPVADILRTPKLADMAARLQMKPSAAAEQAPSIPFDMIAGAGSRDEFVREFASRCDVAPGAIEDAYPLTKLQEGMFILTLQRPGEYVFCKTLPLRESTDIDLLREAWRDVVATSPVLRSRIVESATLGLHQVVLSDDFHWSNVAEENFDLDAARRAPYSSTRASSIFTVVQSSSHASLIWTVHHAFIDGWSLRLILDEVHARYYGRQTPSKVPFRQLLQHCKQTHSHSRVRDFWTRQFDIVEASHYPQQTDNRDRFETTMLATRSVDLPAIQGMHVTQGVLVRAAWGLVLSRKTASTDVLFGCTLSGRNIAVPGIDRLDGPAIATVPIRVSVDGTQLVKDFLDAVQSQMVEMIPFEQTGVAEIASLTAETQFASEFRNLLVVQPSFDVLQLTEERPLWDESEERMDFNTYPMILECFIRKNNKIDLRMKFDSESVSDREAGQLLDQLSLAMRSLAACNDRTVNSIDLLTSSDLLTIWTRNSEVPATSRVAVHDLLKAVAIECGEHCAVDAHDGVLRYSELDALSTQAAQNLVARGLSPGDIVPICSEKSKWVVVAVLAVMKAGCASVLLDHTLPLARLQSIVSQTPCRLLITSDGQRDVLADRLKGPEQITLLSLLDAAFPGIPATLPLVDPSSNLYIVYTSGSSGVPKGAMIAHENFCSALVHQNPPINTTTRVFDVASYSFDMAWYSILHTLYHGGTLCIPSEQERRQDPSAAIVQSRANFVNITPTVAATLTDEALETLQVIELIGEVGSSELVQRLKGGGRVVRNTYGPAECTAVSTISTSFQTPCDIGFGYGLLPWIVNTSGRLAPIGEIGELWLEGPLVGAGYMNDAEKTAHSFVESPDWLVAGVSGHAGRNGRLYRTGDLAKFEQDGSLTYVGRRDNQLKIRGMRVDPGDVEHQVQQVLTALGMDATHLVVDLITRAETAQPTLIAMICGPGIAHNAVESKVSSDLNRLVQAGLHNELLTVLPSHMVPYAFVVLESFPTTASGKTDRRRLKSIASTIDDGAHITLQPRVLSHDRRAPRSRVEMELQRLWGEVLGYEDLSAISIDDHFFALGGNSVHAIKLVALSRRSEIAISIADLFRWPRLTDLAGNVSACYESQHHESLEPFQLLKADAKDTAVVVGQIKALLVSAGLAAVEDAFPCTPLQVALLATGSRAQGTYVAQRRLRLEEHTNFEQLQRAWKIVVGRFSVLRTRMVDLPPHGLIQVVLSDSPQETELQHVCENLEIDTSEPLGRELSRAGVFTADSGERYLCWTAHHVLYDDWTVNLILEDLRKAYFDLECSPVVPFQSFVQRTVVEMDKSAASEFWTTYFADLEAAQFPMLPTYSYQPSATTFLTHSIRSLPRQSSQFTRNVAIRTAWAILLSHYTNNDDVVFGAVLAGRQASVTGIERVSGPTIATVPLRIRLERNSKVGDVFQAVQDSQSSMIPFEQMGLQNIQSTSVAAREACRFQSLLVVQDTTASDHRNKDSIFVDVEEDEAALLSQMFAAFSTYAINLICESKDSHMILRISHDPDVVSTATVQKMAAQFEHVLLQLLEAGDALYNRSLASIQVSSPHDMEDMVTRNCEVPERVSRCVHDMVFQSSAVARKSTAICAWNGTLTYEALDDASDRLARNFRALGLENGDVVPLFFEKSLWTAVAIFATMKAGGVSVLLDVSQPEARLRTILEQVNPVMIAASNAQLRIASKVAEDDISVVTVDERWLDGVLDTEHISLPPVDPSSELYIVFTSGSSGQPKGVSLTHESFSSALIHQQDAIGHSSTTRLLDFASYSFDAAWYNLLHTLYAGGCVCVPSEFDRWNGLGAYIVQNGISFANLTPKVADLLPVEALKTLEVLELSGELADMERVRWMRGHVSVRFAFGPAECSVLSTMSDFGVSIPNIGSPVGVNAWVVSERTEDALAAVGSIGELWLEGPLVGKGYRNDPERTAQSFVTNPKWFPRSINEYARRAASAFYRTGDLVRLLPDGTLDFIGRRDAQIKVRGQRVNLQEVEHMLRRFAPRGDHVVVEPVTPMGYLAPVLIAFVASVENIPRCQPDERPNAVGTWTSVHEKLGNLLPQYMIPTAYIKIENIPMTTTGKTDRRKLREFGARLDQVAMDGCLSGVTPAGPRRSPETAAEKQLRMLWATTLNLTEEDISTDDSFFRRGGDSILAMRLVANARREGIKLSVADVFGRPVLKNMALMSATLQAVTERPIAPFSLSERAIDSRTIKCAASLCDIHEGEIEDILPCTPLQRGLLAMTAKRPKDYIGRHVAKLKRDIDPQRFLVACAQCIQFTPILRTRIVYLQGHGLVQVVLKSSSLPETQLSLDDYLRQDSEQSFALGEPLHRFAMPRDDSSGVQCFVWTLHHAIYDGHAMSIYLDTLQRAYLAQAPRVPTPFHRFVEYVQSTSASQMTREYWVKQFDGMSAEIFPALPSAAHTPRSNSQLSRDIQDLVSTTGDGITMATKVRAAWAMTTASYSLESTETYFGATLTGRQAAVSNVEEIAGPCIATIPLRVVIDWDGSVSALQDQLQTQAAAMIPHEQYGLEAIAKLSEDAARACQFQSLLVVQTAGSRERMDSDLFVPVGPSAVDNDTSSQDVFNTYALMVQVELLETPGSVLAHASYDDQVIVPSQMARIMDQFTHCLRIMCTPDFASQRIRDVDWVCQQDQHNMREWNKTLSAPIETTVQSLVFENAVAQGHLDHQAIHAWDGQFTYRDLDTLSSRLAHLLSEAKFGAGCIAALCFDKSKWLPVAVFGVWKAGGAFTILPSALPAERCRVVLAKASPAATLSAGQLEDHQAGYGAHIPVDETLWDMPVSQDVKASGSVSPASAAAVLFTSGSSGTPKGVVLSHLALASTAHYCSRYFAFGPATRMFQFASYLFDVSLHETLALLASGGCLCIPSEHERSEAPAAALRRFKANTMYITPSASTLFSPEEAPTLENIIFAGEMLRQEHVARWPSTLRFFNWFGPAECALSTVAQVRPSNWLEANIGSTFVGNCWIVDPSRPSKLKPVGSIGELVVQGPALATEYLNDPERTEALFTMNPSWLEGTGNIWPQRMYHSGDLVRLDAHGNLRYCGRKDAQVKIRGQRVELEEVEHHIRQLFSPELPPELLVDVVTPRNSDSPTLLAFIILPNGNSRILGMPLAQFAADTIRRLAQLVPRYMVPSAFVPLEKFPRTGSGKTDRRQLREIVSKWTYADIVLAEGRKEQPKQKPGTPEELRMCALWASTLAMNANDIGLEDSFLQIGGDSIQAMKLSAAARREGLAVGVADIFRHPVLRDLALRAGIDSQSKHSNKPVETTKPFSAVAALGDPVFLRQEASQICGLSFDSIEDIYACTPLQEGLLALSAKQHGNFVAQTVFELPLSADSERFQQAWNRATRAIPILRTRIVDVEGAGLLQVVVDGTPSWTHYKNPDAQMLAERENCSSLKEGLSRFGYFEDQGRRCFVWTVHHALYDQKSVQLILESVQELYDTGEAPELTNFRDFICHVRSPESHSRASEFWRDQFVGIEAETFPALPSPQYRARADELFNSEVTNVQPPNGNYTLPTAIRAAWAILLASYTGTPDTVFGCVVSGRQADLAGVEKMAGPTIATVPVRVSLDSSMGIEHLLRQVQEQSLDMTAHEQMGLQNIRRLSTEAELACAFQTLLLIQPTPEQTTRKLTLFSSHLDTSEHTDSLETFNTYPMMVVAEYVAGAGSIKLRCSFDSRVITRTMVQRLMHRLSDILKCLCGDQPDHTIPLSHIPSSEREEIWRWNETVPQSTSGLVHDMIDQVALQRADGLAVDAWDGRLSYTELADLSSRLAHHIARDRGACPEFIPLLFEKSRCTPVAALAAMKAGAACVLLDASLPDDRLALIVSQTRTRTMLCSRTQEARAKEMGSENVVVVDIDGIPPLRASSPQEPSFADPTSLLYGVFTSGSTGLPKAALISHQNFASAMSLQHAEIGMDETSRVLDFASYAFDMSWYTMLHTFYAGACLCIPPDELRNSDPSAAVRMLAPSFVNMTPTTATFLDDDAIESFQVIELIGETPSWELHSRLMQLRERFNTRVRNTYGPAECSAVTTASKELKTNRDIGYGTGACTWVVSQFDEQSLAPVGAIGELCLEGPLVGQGYLDDVLKTKAVFFSDPAFLLDGVPESKLRGRHGRLYRTGDLVKYDDNGRLIFIGRKDSQVKIRGQRVELGEIQHRVYQHLKVVGEAVSEVVADIMLTDGSPRPILVAFICSKSLSGNKTATKQTRTNEWATGLFQELTRTLPSYMIPSLYIPLTEMPTTASGKTDRRQLREIANAHHNEQESRSATEIKLPGNDIETELLAMWCSLLASKQISVDANFIRLGGDSITAMQLTSRVVRKFNVKVGVREIFMHPTIQDLAKLIASKKNESQEHHLVIQRFPRDSHSALQSFAQVRLSFLDRLNPGSIRYHMPSMLHLRGELSLESLEKAMNMLEDRHEILRTVFRHDTGTDFQIILPSAVRALDVTSVPSSTTLEELRCEIQSEQEMPFALDQEPGWRVRVYRLSDSEHVLSMVMHHIISDGWSADVLLRDLRALYSAAIQGREAADALPSLPIQYRDFSIWQRQEVQVQKHDSQLKYWVNELEGSWPAELPTDRNRPVEMSDHADVVEFRIAKALHERVLAFCAKRQLTSFTVLFSAFRAAHYRVTGAEDSAIGTPVANRDLPELQDLIGLFVNVLCLRTRVQKSDSFESLVHQVSQKTIAAMQHQDVPFERIVAQVNPALRDTSRNPLVQVAFAIDPRRSTQGFDLDGVVARPMASPKTTRLDLELHLYQENRCMSGYLLYSTDLFDRHTITSFASVFLGVLEAGLRDPAANVTTLALDDAVPRSLDQGKSRCTTEGTIIQAFMEHAHLTPNKIAVKDSSRQMTYAELDGESTKLATWLITFHQLPPESVVAVLSPRSCKTLVAFMGIMKAGLAYLPLDPRAPLARLETILSSIPGRTLVLAGEGVDFNTLPATDAKCISISAAILDSTDLPAIPLPAIQPENLAYVVFTSGSSGRPKGVMIEHRNVAQLIHDSGVISLERRGLTVSHLLNVAFDAAVLEIYSALLTGGTLICVEHMVLLNVASLKDLFLLENVQISVFTPTLLKQCLAVAPDMFKNHEVVIVGGDKFPAYDALIAQSFVHGQVFNAYGPTETSVMNTMHAIDIDRGYVNGLVPIGQDIAGSTTYVMDAVQRHVPDGVFGELVIAGAGLARGYFDPAQDKERFVLVSTGERKIRAYRTGDLVRRRPTDGELEFHGRIDQQVKIRGNRVELAEVDHLFLADPEVNESVTISVVLNEGQEAELVTFVSAFPDDVAKQHDDSGARSKEDDQSAVWNSLFDSDTYTSLQHVSNESIGRDFLGWTSKYDGSQLDSTAMNEWLDDTLETILDQQSAGRVLEIGTGSGMILFNLPVEGLESYVGLEPSPNAVRFVTAAAARDPRLSGRVSMHVGDATQISRLDLVADLIIINSVAQYFPGQRYLAKVIEDLLCVPGVKRIVLADIRSFPMYAEFSAQKAIVEMGQNISRADLHRRMADIARMEEELLVDPAFFKALQRRMPDVLSHVEIVPKTMEAINELSSFRYAAILHINSRKEHAVQVPSWIDFRSGELDAMKLTKLLKNTTFDAPLGLSNIPTHNTVFVTEIVGAIEDDPEDERDRDWISGMHTETPPLKSLSAVQLKKLAADAACKVEISWARQYTQRGGLDVVFYRSAPGETRRPLFDFPFDDEGRALDTFTSAPLQRLHSERLEQRLRATAETNLPSYMVPSNIHVSSRIPVTNNGKADYRALSRLATKLRKAPRAERLDGRQPETAAEKQIQLLWASTLGIDPSKISADDSFFEVGGDSIQAMRASAASHLSMFSFDVRDVFAQPVLKDLAVVAGTRQTDDMTSMITEPFSLLPDVSRQTTTSFVRERVAPLLAQTGSVIEDVYPTSSVQEMFLHDPATGRPRQCAHVFLDLPVNVDETRFRSAFATVMDNFDILRTVFFDVAGTYVQAVLSKVDVPMEEVLVADFEDIATVSQRIGSATQPNDEDALSLGKTLLKIYLVRHAQQPERSSRVLLRISHAQYDGITFGHLMHALSAAYQDPAKLSQYPAFRMQIAQQLRSKDADELYWSKLTSGFAMTRIPMELAPEKQTQELPKAYREERRIRLSPTATRHHTPATIFTAAIALMLGSMTGQPDTLFGRVVAGRPTPLAQTLAGPCVNFVPAKIHVPLPESPNMDPVEYLLDYFQSGGGHVKELLDTVRAQHVESLPHESYDYPRDGRPEFWCVSQYQNIDEQPCAVIEGQEIPMGLVRFDAEPTHAVSVFGKLCEDEEGLVRITVAARPDQCSAKTTRTMVDVFCRFFQCLTGQT